MRPTDAGKCIFMRFEDQYENEFSRADMSYCLFVYVTRDYESITCIYGVRDMNSSSWLLCSIDTQT